MATFSTPGVYIQEIPVFAPSVVGVATAVPAFIGYTQKALKDGNSVSKKAIRISSFIEFESIYGGPPKETTIDVTLDEDAVGNFNITASIATPSQFIFYNAVKMYFFNGGGPCYIISVKDNTTYTITPASADFDDLTGGLSVLAKIDEPTLIVMPEVATFNFVATIQPMALSQCNTLQDRFVIMDVISTGAPATDATNFRAAVSSQYLKYGAAYYPNLRTLLSYTYDDNTVDITHNTPSGPGVYNGKDLSDILSGFAVPLTAPNMALYNQVKSAIERQVNVVLPPSSAMAGIYASVDRDRGVWKAPANVSVSQVIAPSVAVTAAQQEGLNIDATSGKSINAIRAFTGKGTLVWGARTLAGNDNEWRYINVRRLFNFAEESIKKATEFVVFEGNDANTWVRVKSLINNFLTNLWRDGALVGAKPEQAFFVKVGLNETMTAQDILEGKMIVQVGLAASRPAEFIILQFMHKLQES